MSNTKFVLRTVVLAIAGSVLVFLSVGMLLADRWQVKTTRTIQATAAQVAERVTDLRQWPKWSSLDFKVSNQPTVEFTGTAGSTDQVGTWRGDIAIAALRLTRVDETGVDYEIGFQHVTNKESFGGRYTGTIEWRQVGDSTQVTWTEDGVLSDYFQRWSNWFGALQDKVQQVQRASLGGLDEIIRRENDKAAKAGGQPAGEGTEPPK